MERCWLEEEREEATEQFLAFEECFPNFSDVTAHDFTGQVGVSASNSGLARGAIKSKKEEKQDENDGGSERRRRGTSERNSSATLQISSRLHFQGLLSANQ